MRVPTIIKSSRAKWFLLALFLFVNSNIGHTWGFWAHQRINRQAIFILPPELLIFYKNNIGFITAQSVAPDKRRYAVKNEAPRHYIDLDHYGNYPYNEMPRNWKEAVAKFSEDTLNAYGIGPWHISRMAFRLTQAFKEKDLDRILKLSAEIGHYFADSHVPLHNTENYNGQLTGQKGIHGFWESRLPELFGEEYNYFVGRAEYMPDINASIWQIVLESSLAVDSVLKFEREIAEEINNKYEFEERGERIVKVYSQEYSSAYHEKLNGMVERRMRKAVKNIGSLWFTTWVNAGQPDLTILLDAELSEKEQKLLEKEKKMWNRRGKIFGRAHE